jgi:hypothetical protein
MGVGVDGEHLPLVDARLLGAEASPCLLCQGRPVTVAALWLPREREVLQVDPA